MISIDDVTEADGKIVLIGVFEVVHGAVSMGQNVLDITEIIVYVEIVDNNSGKITPFFYKNV